MFFLIPKAHNEYLGVYPRPTLLGMRGTYMSASSSYRHYNRTPKNTCRRVCHSGRISLRNGKEVVTKIVLYKKVKVSQVEFRDVFALPVWDF